MTTTVTVSADDAAFTTRNSIPSHAWKVCRSCLGPGLRTALACLIVGCVTIYSPVALQQQLTFPAFSYVTAVLLVGEATVGNILHGAFSALYGTTLAMPTTVLSLWVIGPKGLSVATTTVAVTLCSFMVTLPESTNLITKRIALGQIVLVYAEALRQGRGTSPILHPQHVATSTMLGVTAAVLAVILPYPRLACQEVKKKKEEFTTIVIERLRLFLVAFYATDKASALASLSQIRFLSKKADKLIQDIKMKQEHLQWERPQINISPDQWRSLLDKLQTMELLLEGMNIALSSTSLFPIKMLTPQLACLLQKIENHINLALKGKDNQVVKKDMENKKACSLPLADTVTLSSENLPPLFFLFSFTMLCHEILEETKETVIPKASHSESSPVPELPTTVKATKVWKIQFTGQTLMVALKCSLSIGLAMLLGVLYSKNDGYWSGLIVATTITTKREATFKFANLRAHGTAVGSIYGILGTLISQKLIEVRFLVLLPWIIFTGFLKQSQMYGQAGGVAAAISAILILGRKNYGNPTTFAIVRLIETFIGLFCSIFTEILMQPTRAATLARSKLCQSLHTLSECIELLISSSIPGITPASLLKIKARVNKLIGHIQELKRLSVDAEGEPNFLFLPFPCLSYAKLHRSLIRMAELLMFAVHTFQSLPENFHESGIGWDECQSAIKGELELLNMAGKTMMHFGDVMQIKSLVALRNKPKRTISDDPEVGTTTYPRNFQADVEQHKSFQASVLNQMVDFRKNQEFEDDGTLRTDIILNCGALVYCIECVVKETEKIEMSIMEIVQMENPSKCMNLREICNEINNVSNE